MVDTGSKGTKFVMANPTQTSAIQIVNSQVCGRCKFSRPNPERQPGIELLCKRNPPHGAATLMGRRQDGQPLFAFTSFYPAVGEHEEGCGEWVVKIQLAN